MMKVILEFDSKSDNAQVICLAVRAEDVYLLIDHLLDQLAEWIDENPSDEQGKAFAKTRRWLCDEIFDRGLYQSTPKKAVSVDRAGNPLARPNKRDCVQNLTRE